MQCTGIIPNHWKNQAKWLDTSNLPDRFQATWLVETLIGRGLQPPMEISEVFNHQKFVNKADM